MTRRFDFVILLATLPAAVVPFVAFGGPYVPLEVLWKNVLWEKELGLGLIAAPVFLGVMIVFWQLRRLVASRSSGWERWLAYALASLSTAASITIVVSFIVDAHLRVPIGLAGLPAPIGCAMLFWWLMRKAPAEGLPFAALALAYLTHMALPLYVFEGKGIGWWLTLIAAAGLMVQLADTVWRTRAALRVRSAPAGPVDR